MASFLEDVESMDDVSEFVLNIDGVEFVVTNIKKQTVLDFVHYKSIEESGIIYAPSDDDKILLVKWFTSRNCNVLIRVSKKFSPSFIMKIWSMFKVRRLNKILEGGIRK